jgi:beta-galactosidase GanA
MFQQVVNGFDYNRFVSEQIYRPLQEIQLRPDVLAAGAPLDGYKLIITPFMLTLEEKELDKRIIEWVNNGGTWVAGPMTDIRTPAGTKYKNAPYGHLEDWTNNRLEFMLPPGESFNIRYADGTETETVSLIYEALTAGDNVNILAKYNAEGGYIDGYAAITETKVGRGRIIMLGALLKPQAFAAFILKLAKECKIEPVTEASPSVVTALRAGEAGELFTAVETADKAAFTVIPFGAENIITGEKYSAGQKLALNRHDVVLAKKI